MRPRYAGGRRLLGLGSETEWIRNLRARPALEIQIGRESYVPEQRFLSEAESMAVVTEFRARHQWRTRPFTTILGWGDSSSDAAVRQLVRSRPFVEFRPTRAAGTQLRTSDVTNRG